MILLINKIMRVRNVQKDPYNLLNKIDLWWHYYVKINPLPPYLRAFQAKQAAYGRTDLIYYQKSLPYSGNL